MSGRIRTVKPEWLDDELLAGASDEARVLSIGLILMADDYGNGRGSDAEIAMAVWRFEMCREDGAKARETLAKVSRALRELVAMRFVGLWDVRGQRYFSIRRWNEHQKVDKKGKPRVPSPPAGLFSAENDDSRDPRETVATPSRDPRETLAPDLDHDHDHDHRPGGGSRARASRAAPEAPTPSIDRGAPDPSMGSAESLAVEADAIARAVGDAIRKTGRSAPPRCGNPADRVWVSLVPFVREEAARRHATTADVRAQLAHGFAAHEYARSRGYSLKFLEEGPGEFLSASSQPSTFAHVTVSALEMIPEGDR